MDISPLIKLDPKNKEQHNQFREEFLKIAEEHGIGDTLSALLKHTLQSPEGLNMTENMKKRGFSSYQIAVIRTGSLFEGIKVALQPKQEWL
ncbi:MAG: hypothetical protein EXS48_00400 [Candidatus Staskawiczbacteria bacterium]|nr:hypothetical protein [Candidatus Staskawiczbacteria bacterium]